MPAFEKVSAEVEWPCEVPELDEKGYPLAGEYVYADEEQGIWFYASPTLVVRVDRIFDEQAVVTRYEAHIFCDPQEEHFGSVLYNPENPQKKHVQAKLIARENQVVFGMNTDYYTYRLGRKTTTGRVIRGGEVFFDRVPEANRSKFPNLDTLAMLRLADHLAGAYRGVVDRSLLLAGTLLHDVAKEEEFTRSELGLVTDYSVKGQLLGHLVMGAQAAARAAEACGMPEEKSVLLQHMILSHHGEPEFGAAVRPMCAESELLSCIDIIDSRMEIYREALAQVPVGEFSSRIFALEKKIYHHP